MFLMSSVQNKKIMIENTNIFDICAVIVPISDNFK